MFCVSSTCKTTSCEKALRRSKKGFDVELGVSIRSLPPLPRARFAGLPVTGVELGADAGQLASAPMLPGDPVP